MFAPRRLLAFFLSCCSALAAQTIPTVVPPKPDYSQEAFVSEQSDSKITFENDGTYVRTDHGRVRIQSEAGVQRFGVLTLQYESASDHLDIDYVRVKKSDGSLIATPAENVQDMAAEITRQAPFYSDVREKHIAVKGLSTGDVLEYQVRWTCDKPLVPGQFWYAANFTKDAIILEQQLIISVPRDRSIKVKSPTLKSTIAEDGKYLTYTWNAANLETKSDKQQKEEQLERAQEQAKGQFPWPDVMISSFQTWDEVGRWYEGLQAERVKPSAEVRAKAAELTKGVADETAKIRAIYSYVSTEYHYIGVAFGIGRYQPHTASEILENRYGDCKDKHTLLASLLDAAGIKAYPALINAGQEIDPDVPSPGQFNHVITVVPQGKDLLWLDATVEVAPFGYLISRLHYKHALVIINGTPAALTETPGDLAVPPSEIFTLDGKLSDSGELEGKVDFTVSGGDAEVMMRSAFRRTAMPQWKDLVQGIAYTCGFGGDVSEVTATSPEKLDEPFHLTYKYKRKDFPDWSNRRIAVALPPFSLPSRDDPPSSPIWLGAPQQISYISRVEVPKAYTPQIPVPIDLKEDFGTYRSSYTFKNGTLTCERQLTSALREVPVAKYEAYKKFTKNINDDESSYISLSTGLLPSFDWRTAIWTLPDSDNPEAQRTFEEGRERVQAGDFSGMSEHLKAAVAADPKFTRAWLLLAEYYDETRQGDAAEAFRKAIESNPTQPISYKAFGFSLMKQQKYDDAVTVWQHLIKVSPQDIDGPMNLGSAFLRLKRYKDAATAYESAAQAKSDSSDIFASLGSAYLHMGDEQKALTAYNRALEIDSEPGMFNNLAYELADENKQLPLALEWADKAVRGQEEASAKIDLEKLELKDLGQANRLAADWDTLGWVYFRMGKFAESEKYLKASWMLSLGATQKDHLEQVYEEQHKKFSEDENGIRTVRLPKLVDREANAEYFVLFSRNPKTSAAKVEAVKFIKGSDKLKSADKVLANANFEVMFPDDGPTRLLRRGILGCYQYTGCSFVLLMPNTVHSLN